MDFFVEPQGIFNADISNVAETGQLSPENLRTKHLLFCFSLKDRLASILLSLHGLMSDHLSQLDS